ncbi:hypothetical protein [Flavobacterium undicola]|uniref:hypothetical protein n=1 Tax=Flavobacterium undicola TaxID=1932779 RepID=UPI001377C76A|nr:hypothetical protein [Flavobacterium undicola]MBA0884938.1 hypothetical protein [Flavobacterium undicola]
MKTIILKKNKLEDFLILQNVVAQFRTKKWDILHTNIYNDAYFNNMLAVDVATNLFFRLRIKIENQNKSFASFNLKIHEAIILLQCCNDYKAQHEDVVFIVRKYFNELHKQLINL